ncbi:hypothetical protein [Phyllobacterium endophyticum]|uniref:Uncharacterized protein n=1 Tax=Phyllobacterium endophyticum TaxID=1149773 RepID=A0A2P7B1S7_9HYPH|nr:hypothetical protein [Phyllobacterium endophyticum]MBB3237959.1 hypothetical protein [Phyllobacterium endophyticum]PSH60384.1 hypothetical protein CU100_06785 [Phyllobacterium endophyticum]TYR42561.1 hypothetical protein FY050_15330 [Phyllobacterium endophyticum]
MFEKSSSRVLFMQQTNWLKSNTNQILVLAGANNPRQQLGWLRSAVGQIAVRGSQAHHEGGPGSEAALNQIFKGWSRLKHFSAQYYGP